MKCHRLIGASSLGALLLLGCSETTKPLGSEQVTARRPFVEETREVERDNTAVNARDRDNTTTTPIDQNENKEDVGITADIRKRIVDTKMSINAQNVKVITQGGRVTLRGPVDSAEEKQRVEEIAAEVAGQGNIDSQLEVKSEQ